MKSQTAARVATFAFVLLTISAFGQTIPAPSTGDSMSRPAPKAGDHMPMHHASRPSTMLTVTLNGHDTTLRLSDLQAMPQQTVTVMNGHTKTSQTYSGPSLTDVLARAGLGTDPASQHALLHQIVIATGTDGYFVVYAAAGLTGGFSGAQSIVAFTVDGKPLVDNGSFMLIHSTDKKPARWVRNLVSLSVRTISQ